MRPFLLLVFCASALQAQQGNQPVPPFRIIGNVFYVGASDITSYLIATPKGHIVIDGGLAETAPMIEKNIEKLGFHLLDVRILLNTHAHFDHAGGLAALKAATNATLMVSEQDAPLFTNGGKGDPQFGDKYPFPAVRPNQLLRDGDHVALGGSILTAHITPGHTHGGTTWTKTVHWKTIPYNVVIVTSPTVPTEYRLVGNEKDPEVVADYRKQFEVLKALPCDVFLGSHGSFFDLAGKAARRAKGETPNPFIDPEGYRRFVAQSEKAFEEALKKQKQ
jgi:metallo-beta-lactamase class B